MMAVAGVPLMTGGAAGAAVAVSAFTRITNGPIEPLAAPSVAVMVMSPVMPTAAVLGVPLKVPVLESNVAHAGSPLTAKVTTPLVAAKVGANE
jgi:hypothetical protein